MNAILLLMGLLALSYLGNLLGGRTIRGAGLPSSVEYVVLGFALGPQMLGLFGRELLDAFEPIAEVAIGWLAFVIGLDFGRTGARRTSFRSASLGLLAGALTGGGVAAAVLVFLVRVRHLPLDVERVLLAGGLGAACAETTRYAVRWAIERYGARGPLTTVLNDFAHADDFVPIFATAILFALAPAHPFPFVGSAAAWIGITVGLGVVLGLMAAMHIGRELRVDQTWGVLLGTTVLGVGVAARLGLSILTVLFFMGLTTAALSRHRTAIRAMVRPVDRPILLPALLLSGAYVNVRVGPVALWLIVVAIAARIVAKLVVALLVRFRVKVVAGPLLGVGLLSSGALSMMVGLSFALRFPGPTGDAVLAAAAVACVLGEAVGPTALRRVLRDADEIKDEAPDATETVAS